jgi:hypothetical protein
MTRFGVALSVAAVVLSLGAGAAFGGEITGNGKVLEVNGRSICAFSGQEDDQFKEGGSKGDPGHAQSWGQIPKEVRDLMGPAGYHPGMACNPNIGPPPPPEE